MVCKVNRNTQFLNNEDHGLYAVLTFRRQIKSHLPFAGIIRRVPYSTHFQDKG